VSDTSRIPDWETTDAADWALARNREAVIRPLLDARTRLGLSASAPSRPSSVPHAERVRAVCFAQRRHGPAARSSHPPAALDGSPPAVVAATDAAASTCLGRGRAPVAADDPRTSVGRQRRRTFNDFNTPFNDLNTSAVFLMPDQRFASRSTTGTPCHTLIGLIRGKRQSSR
jgi:hypothetical protein